MQKGLFIAVEGGDFSGKTTFVKQLKEVLDEVDFSTVLFRSPGGDEAGEKIRELVTQTPFSEEVRTLLFAANRVHLTQAMVKPLIEKGINVISTRWRWSSDVYQDNKDVADFADEQFDVAVPDMYILLECDDEVMKKTFDKRNQDHPDYDPDTGNQLDVLDEEYTRDYQGVKARFNEKYEQHNGVKFKFNYNQGEPKPPTNEQFIELIKPLLIELGYYEIGTSTIPEGLVHDANFDSATPAPVVDESLFPQARV